MYLHFHNAGENVAFEKACKQEGGVDFKYTSPGMPQQNDRINQKFNTFLNQVYAMLN